MASAVQPTIQIDTSKIPEYVRDDLSRVLLRGVRAYFSDPKHMEDYKRWSEEYDQRQREKGGAV